MNSNIPKTETFFMGLRLCRAPGYPTETVITQFHFSVSITRERLLKIPTVHLSRTNGSLWFFVNKMCVGNGILQVVFNIEAGNYYSKYTFIMTLHS